MSKIKGTGLIAAVNYISQYYGPHELERVINALQPEDRDYFATPYFLSVWYDYPAFVRFVLQADRLLGKGDFDIPRKIGFFNAIQDIRGVYKLFVKILKPEAILKKSAVLWHQIIDTGTLAVSESSSNHFKLTLLDFPDIPLHHEFGTLGYIENLITQCGGKNPLGNHTQCCARGDKVCVFEFDWD